MPYCCKGLILCVFRCTESPTDTRMCFCPTLLLHKLRPTWCACIPFQHLACFDRCRNFRARGVEAIRKNLHCKEKILFLCTPNQQALTHKILHSLSVEMTHSVLKPCKEDKTVFRSTSCNYHGPVSENKCAFELIKSSGSA